MAANDLSIEAPRVSAQVRDVANALIARWSRRPTRRPSHHARSKTALSVQRSDCLFCLKYSSQHNTIMIQNKSFFARYDNFPAAQGHVEIVPKRHVASFFDLTETEIREAFKLLLEAKEQLAVEYKPAGYTIGVNEGEAAGRSIDHLHIHLIPRYHGDVADPRGGIRQILPNCDPDLWASSNPNLNLSIFSAGH